MLALARLTALVDILDYVAAVFGVSRNSAWRAFTARWRTP